MLVLCGLTGSMIGGPLHDAVKSGLKRNVRDCLRRGEDLNGLDEQGFTPIFYSLKHNNILELLLRKNADPNKICNGLRPLHQVIKEYSLIRTLEADHATGSRLAILDSVAMLLQHSADPNLVAGDGNTPLHLAVQTSTQLTALLVVSGANINAVNSLGQTPLHVAVLRGRQKNVRILLGDRSALRTRYLVTTHPMHSYYRELAVAKKDEKDQVGNTPLIYALKNIVNIINEAKTNFPPQVRAEKSAMIVITHNLLIVDNIVNHLLVAGARPSLAGEFGNTPMHILAAFSRTAPTFPTLKRLANVFIGIGIDINFLNDQGATPLDLSQGDLKELLIRCGAKSSAELLP